MVPGICKLCQQHANLQDSHLIPRAVYKHIRRSRGTNNKIVAVSRTVATFSDKQVKDYLLCAVCEDRFGQVENWTLSNCLRDDGSFPFRDALLSIPRHPQANEVALGHHLKGGEIEKLAYFAASVLWRAAVHRWKEFGSTIALDLGPYEEEFRQYLLGMVGFPEETALAIFVAEKANERDQFATTPVPLDVKGYHQYTLAIPGIKFSMFIGKTLPVEARDGCSLRSNGRYIYLNDHLDNDEVAFQMQRTRISRKVQEGAKVYENSKP